MREKVKASNKVKDISKRPTSQDRRTPEWNKYFEHQAYHAGCGGFCGDCGEAIKPIYNNDIEVFGKCPYNGEHPEKAAA